MVVFVLLQRVVVCREERREKEYNRLLLTEKERERALVFFFVWVLMNFVPFREVLSSLALLNEMDKIDTFHSFASL